MQEMLALPPRSSARDWRQVACSPTADSAANSRVMIGHVAPEAAVGGPIATCTKATRSSSTLKRAGWTLDLSHDEIAAPAPDGSPPAPRYTHGVLAKYAALVSSA